MPRSGTKGGVGDSGGGGVSAGGRDEWVGLAVEHQGGDVQRGAVRGSPLALA